MDKIVQRFESAVRAHAVRGGGDPVAIPQIEREYEDAKGVLLVHIQRLKDQVKEARDEASRLRHPDTTGR